MYRTISVSFWTDPKVKELPADAKLFLLYLITNPHTHVSGIYNLHLGYAALDCGLDPDRVSAILDILSGLGFCSFDRERGVIWVRRMMAYQGRGDKNYRSAARHVTEDLHESPLCDQFLAAYPEVARYLGKKKKARDKIPNKLRYQILERDGGRCVKCGATAADALLEIDHIIPFASGGKTELGNLQTLCQPCNHGKSDRVSAKPDRVSRVGTPEQEQEQDISIPVNDSLNIKNSNPEREGEKRANSSGKRKRKKSEKPAVPEPSRPEPQRLPFGEFQRAFLSEEEITKLKQRLNGHHDEYIERFDHWVNEAPDAKGKDGVKRKDRHAYESINAWYSRDLREGNVKEQKQEKTFEQLKLEMKQRHGLT